MVESFVIDEMIKMSSSCIYLYAVLYSEEYDITKSRFETKLNAQSVW